MRQRLNKKWLVMLIVVLGAAGFWGWRHSQADHEHEGHLQQGQVHQDHDHDHDHAPRKPTRRRRLPAG